MATRTRRLDVEIGSEAKGSGFRDTDRELSKLEKQFANAGNKAGKGLADGLEDGTDKLGSQLKNVGSRAGEKLGEGIKSGTSNVGSTLESAGSNAADLFANGFDPAAIGDILASGLESTGGKLGTAAAGIGLVAGTAFATGLLNGMEAEVSTDRLAAQLGGSEWAEDMGGIAGNLYLQGFGDSVADVGVAVRKVVQNGLLPEDATNEQIETLTGRLLTFTDVMEQDMDMATQAVSSMLRSGIADSGTEALDILTRGIQQGADKAGDLQETFQEYSTMFREVGLSGQDAMGLITQGLQAGARDADTVADALKEFAIRAQDGSETSKAGFEAIGLSASEMTAAVAAGGPTAKAALDQVLDGLQGMEDPAERNAAAVALFGTKAEDLGDALFSLDLDTAAAGLGETAGATDKLGSAYDNASSKIETFKRQALQELTVFVGEQVLPKLEALKAWATENPGAFQAIAAVIGGVLVVAFLAWAVSAGAAAVATIAATWPIIAIGLAVAALAALVVIHFDTIKRWVMGVFNWIKTNWPLLLAILTGPFGLAALAIARNWQSIKAGATAVKDWIVAKFNAVVDFITGLPGKISDAASGMWDGIASAFKSMINMIIGWWNGLRIPGFGIHINGPGPIPDLDFSWSGLSLPNISPLAEGAVVRSRPGGILANIGEGGHDEAVIPLDGNHGLGGDTYVSVTVNAKVIRSDSELEDLVVEALRRAGTKGKPITIAGRRL